MNRRELVKGVGATMASGGAFLASPDEAASNEILPSVTEIATLPEDIVAMVAHRDEIFVATRDKVYCISNLEIRRL